jgi:predicted nuclease of predicted toxin-antitoxin system
MKIQLDENIPADAATIFLDAGCQVATVLDQGLGGKADSKIAAVCRAENRVLITLDTDFSNIGAYPPEDYSGIIVLRLANQAKPHILSILARLLDSLGQKSPSAHLWIVEEYRIRIRPGDE